MASIFLKIFKFFVPRKGLFTLCAGIIAVGAALLITRTHFEEDISKIMPTDEALADMNKLLEQSELADRIVVSISRTDTLTHGISPDPLIAFCDKILKALPEYIDTQLLEQITARVDEGQFRRIYDTLYQHLPLFLEPEDYDVIAARIDPDSMGRYLQGVYRLLVTPGGSFVKSYILQDPLSITPLALNRLKQFNLDDNFELYDGYVVTRDYRNLLLFLTPAVSSRETRKNTTLIKGLNSMLSDLNAGHDNVSAEYFGAAMVAVDNAQQVRKDVTLTVTIAVLILFLLITYFFRRPRVFFFLILPTLFGALVALGILGWVNQNVSIISIGIGSVLLGITIDYALHIFTHLRATGDRIQAIRELVWPILVSSLTTAAAFLCLFIVRSEGLHDLGAFAALSVTLTAICALIILPLLPVRLRSASEGRTTFIEHWAGYPLHKRTWMRWLLLVISVICLFGAGKVAFEDDLYKINFMSPATTAAEAHLNALTSTTHRGVYVASSGLDLAAALDVEKSMLPLLDSLKTQSVISQYAAVSKLIPSTTEQQSKIDVWNRFWTPGRIDSTVNTLEAEAQNLGFKAGAFDRFIEFLRTPRTAQPVEYFKPVADAILPGYVSTDSTRTTLLSLLSTHAFSGDAIYPYFEQRTNVRILDKGYLVSRFVDILRQDFKGLVLISFLIVFLILHLALGRFELSMITFVPVTLSWIWTLGFMHFLGLKFNIINVIITSFIFGLGIDYSIFIIRGLLHEYQYASERLKTYKTSVLLSVITTLAGIGVMIFAKHPALRSISAISVIGIISVVVFAFTLQPLLFNWLFFRKDGRRREYPLTLGNTMKTLVIYSLLAAGTIVVTLLSVCVRLLTLPFPEFGKLMIHQMICKFSRFYIRVSFFPHYRFLNPHGEDFKRPAIIIANHMSHIDTTIMFSLTPKLVILTKDWVHRFPLYYLICRLADFYTVSEGLDAISGKLMERVRHGYHISLFPEGSRSETDTPKRFHKGAFVLADAFQLDILPVYIHGTGRYLRKGSFWGQSNDVTVEIGERIPFEKRKREQLDTKPLYRTFKQHHKVLTRASETCRYHRRKLIENYIYKGPILEQYLRVKLRLEDYYAPFDSLVPEKGYIVDLGCGYGFMDYMLHFRAPERRILGVDYDAEKINTANHCHAKNDMIGFVQGDVTEVDFTKADAIIISDVLHYLDHAKQTILLERAYHRLAAGGKLIIRDGDKDLKKRHLGTRLTEVFSTGLGFNKTQNALHYISGAELIAWAQKKQLEVRIIDKTRLSSNVIYCFSRVD